MDTRLKAFQTAGRKAVEFQLTHQQPDGSFIWDESIPDAYHKQPYSWSISGRLPAAHRLLDWVRKNALREDGSLYAYRGDVHKMSWFFHGAHRVGRFDLSYPVMNWLMAQQKEGGGLPHFAEDDRLRSLPTAWVGVSAIHFGRLDVALRAAEWCIGLLDQPEEGRFYFQTTLDGSLLTSSMAEDTGFIDLTKTEQPYWEIGLPWLLMGQLYLATEEERWLEHAGRFFRWQRGCPEDNFAHVSSGASSLAATIHFRNTGDVRARDAAIAFCEFLLATQHPDGGWRSEGEPDEPITYIDHAAEYNVWLQEIAGLLGAMSDG